MIITLQKKCSEADLSAVQDFIAEQGGTCTEVTTERNRYLVTVGEKSFDIRRVGHMSGVSDVHTVSSPYQLVSRSWKAQPTVVPVSCGDEEVLVAEGGLTMIAGPCSVESEEQMHAVAAHLVEQGVRLMRGGAFKPRTSPYSFDGLKLDGLKMFKEIAASNGLGVVTEIVSAAHLDAMHDYVDVFQVGTRNAQNFDLLRALGGVRKPVLLKRGMSSTLNELLQAAEYIYSGGNSKIILCERGIRTFETSYRNTLDVNAIPALKQRTHLPVVVDPSHGVGVRRWVESVALAGLAAGADGVIYETHPEPMKALSDGQQTLNFNQSRQLLARASALHELRMRW